MTKLAERGCSLPGSEVNGTEIRQGAGFTMYTGMLDLCPKIIVDQSTFETFRNTRGRNHTLGVVSPAQRQVVIRSKYLW